MQRRNFLKGIAASAGALVVPVPVAAKSAAVGRTTYRAVGFHYGWACVYAQRNNGITAADIAAKFKVSTAEANALFERMLNRGVLSAPGLDGRSHATETWQPWDQRHPVGPAQSDAQAESKTARQRSEAARLAESYRAMIEAVTAHSTIGLSAA